MEKIFKALESQIGHLISVVSDFSTDSVTSAHIVHLNTNNPINLFYPNKKSCQ